MSPTALQSRPPTPASIAHFRRNPHLAKHLSSTSYCAIGPFQHTAEEPRGERAIGYFFEKTLSTPTTIPHCLGLHLNDFLPIPRATGVSQEGEVEALGPPHYLGFMAFSSPGISGHPFVAHGGLLSAVIDENLGVCIEVQQTPPFSTQMFTAVLDIHYKKPVPVPGDYIIRTWVTGRDRRKFWTRGDVVSSDGEVVYATGTALMIQARNKGEEKL